METNYDMILKRHKQELAECEDDEMREIIKKCEPKIQTTYARARALEQKMKSLQTQLINHQLEKNLLEKEQPQLQQIYNQMKKIKEDTKPFYFITINPKPTADLNDFIAKVHTIKNLSWIKKMHYVFEQRGDSKETKGKGFHSHILLEDYDNEFGKIKSQMKRMFQGFCNQPYENTINVYQKKREWLEDKLDYIKGKKLDEEKPEKVIIDKEWRQDKQLEAVYTFDCLTDKKQSNRGGTRVGAGRKKKIKEVFT